MHGNIILVTKVSHLLSETMPS